MKTNLKFFAAIYVWFCVTALAWSMLTAHAAGPQPEPQIQAPTTEQVNVDTIKQKYWARGDESEMGVVQNRLYSKERKLELGLFSGVIATDPFLSVKNLGISAGFHFSEYLAAHVLYWKDYVSPSTALKTFEDTLKATTNNNRPKSFMGIEGSASVLYGKLSLLGKAIIYYDFHLLGGLGRMATESGNYFAPLLGVGQQVYLSKAVSVRVDYRLLRFNEMIVEKVITPKLGQPVGVRTNYSNTVTFGVTFIWGPGK